MSLPLRRPGQAVATVVKTGCRWAYQRLFNHDVGPMKPWRIPGPNWKPPRYPPVPKSSISLQELVSKHMKEAEEDGMKAQREEQRQLREAGLLEPEDKEDDKSPKDKTK